jgi:hypothetical protein
MSEQQNKYLDFFRERIPNMVPPNDKGESVNPCIFHGNTSPSLAVNVHSGVWKCYTPSCPGHAGGKWKKFEQLLTGEIPTAGDIKPPPIEPAAIQGFHEVLLQTEDAMAILQKRRGYTLETIKHFKLGWDGDRILIPIVGLDGSILNVRKYKYGAPKDKFIAWGPRYNRARLFPVENLKHQRIYIFAGEPDCMLACQLGLPAITSTGGEDAWPNEYNDQLRGKDIVFVYDVDPPGRKAVVASANKLVRHAKSVSIATLPLAGTKEEKDFTDYILHLKHSVEDFEKHVIAHAQPVQNLVTEAPPPDEVHDIHLSRIGLDEYVGKRVRATVLVAGKDLAPFQVPKIIGYSCASVGSMKACDVCGICAAGGQKQVQVPDWSQAMIQMVNTPIEKLNAHLSRLAEVPDRCPKFKFEVKRYQNVEAIKCIPEIDFTATESEYVIRSLFYLGEKLETNRTYTIEAVVMPEPKTQYATALIYEAVPAHDTVEKFELTEDVQTMLRLFQCP